MTMHYIINRLNLLNSEKTQLERELRMTPMTEIMTMKGRIRLTVVSRLRNCNSEINNLKMEKIKLENKS